MKQQIVRIIDPNYTFFRDKSFEDGGRSMLSLMKARGVDKKVRDEMRVYLATQARDAKFKKTALNKQITRYGHPLTSSAFGADVLGIYNPDTIPVDTYFRMKNDPQVAIGLAMIKMPIISLGWNVECEDVDIREFVRYCMTKIWRRLVTSSLTAIDFGFSSHELVWDLEEVDIFSQSQSGRKKTHFRGKAEVLKKVKAHYPSTVKIRTDANTDDFIGIRQVVPGKQEVSLDIGKTFMFTVGDEFGNFFGTSRLKAVYKTWYWKEVLTQFMMRYFERKGGPATVVTHPIGGGIDVDGNDYDNADIALRISHNLLENSTVTLPYEANKDGNNQWGITYLQDDRRGEMFVAALNYLAAQTLRGLLVPERVMTQDLSTGSFSMATSHAEIFLLSEEGLSSQLADSINEQIIPPLIQFNFNPKKVVPCYFKVEKIQYDRRRILKEIMVEIIRNMNSWIKDGKTPNVLPSLEQMSDILGIPVAAVAEEYTDTGVVDNTRNIGNKDGNNNADNTDINDRTNNKSKEIKRTPVKKQE